VDCAAYTALYNYQSADVRDLTFIAGDVIMVHEMSGEWWTGSIGSRFGMFPANYVVPVNPQSVGCCSSLVCATCLVSPRQSPESHKIVVGCSCLVY